MNLTDGTILCGRKYFDGSGGNNHALEHFRKTGFPLAVKLGTITPNGAGRESVYSVIFFYFFLVRVGIGNDSVICKK